MGAIKLKEVSDGEEGRLSKEVWGGVVKLKHSKYVISRRGHLLDLHVKTKSHRKKSP